MQFNETYFEGFRLTMQYQLEMVRKSVLLRSNQKSKKICKLSDLNNNFFIRL